MDGLIASEQTSLDAPYAISYDIDEGLDLQTLTRGGKASNKLSDVSMKSGSVAEGVISALNPVPTTSHSLKVNIPGGTKTVRSSFDRESRTCHICTEITTRECKQTGVSILFFDNRKMECGADQYEQTCEDIKM